MTINFFTTQAAILNKTAEPLVVDEITLPTKLTEHQVFCEVITSGVCGAQINEINAVKGPDRFLPHLLGHEGFAKVLEVGPGVSTIYPGDYGVMHWRPGLGNQAKPAEYLWKSNKLNAGWVTTFNKHCVISENRITKVLGSSYDINLLPMLGCALTTAYGVLTNNVQASSSDSLLIFGAGGVGLALIKVARYLKISEIVVVDPVKSRLEFATRFGISEIVEFRDKSQVFESLKSYYKKKLPSIAIDTSGNTDAIELCYELSTDSGSAILVGVPKAGTFARIHTLPLHFGKILKGSHGGDSKPHEDIPKILDLIERGVLDLSDYPVSIFSLNDINEAISQLENGSNGRMLIKF